MKRSTKLFLLAGCALILVLDAPAAFTALASGWRGPYAGRAETRSAKAVPALPRTGAAAEGLQLARR